MRKVLIGIAVGALLATAIPVAAEEINKKVTATVRGDFTLEVDGNLVSLKNVPLAYDGNSYLPVRELATLLGKEVDFKDGVIKLSTPITEPKVELARLKKNIETTQELVDKAKESLADENLAPEQRVVAEESLQSFLESLELYENKKAALLEQYPELAE